MAANVKTIIIGRRNLVWWEGTNVSELLAT